MDTEIEEFLRKELSKLTPEWSVEGEELPYFKGSDPSYCWVLDPQDGTSAFLRGFRGSSVSIALLDNHEPVLGVVHAPLYPNDSGDTIYGARGVGLFRNGKQVRHRERTEPLGPQDIVAVSQDADQRIEFNLSTLAPARYLPMPSIAYRLALAAAGDVRAATSLAPLRPLDVAAGHALLLLSGGQLHHLSAPDNPVVCYRRNTGFHGVVGGDKQAIRCLTPWPWNRGFGPKQKPPLARPARHLKASGAALDRAQGCLMGLVAADSMGRPDGHERPGEAAESAITTARRLLSQGGLNRGWSQRFLSDSAVLGLVLTPPMLAASYPEHVYARAISHAIEGASPKRAAAETAPEETRAFGYLIRQTPLREAVLETTKSGGDPASVGALLGAFQGYDSVPRDWRLSVLTYRPHGANCQAPRPIDCWAVDTLIVAEQLLHLRKNLSEGATF